MAYDKLPRRVSGRPKASSDLMPDYVRYLLFGALGVAVGFSLGLVFMGTVHTMLEIRAERHYTEDPGAQLQQGKGQQQQQQQQVSQPQQKAAADDGTQNNIHVMCTSNGSPYVNFQNRIMYGTFKRVQKMPGGEKLVAFTRVLHRTKLDVLVEEIPTFRANPLTPACDTWCEFPVSDRPDAVEQWMKAAEEDPSMIKAPWILMIETDYVWHKPVQAPRADSDALPIAFPFGYIQPTNPGIKDVMRIMYPAEKGPLSDVPNSGPAPALLRWSELQKIVPDWKRLTAHIEAHKETKEKLGWVREMYAWSVAAALNGVKFDLTLPPKQTLIVQPPADHKIGDAAMFHYTWGSIINEVVAGKTQEVWKFDKRFYTDANLPLKVPAIKPPPPFREGLRLQDGIPVDRDLHSILDQMIADMNAVIPGLTDLTQKARHYPTK